MQPPPPLYACLPNEDDTNPDTMLAGFLDYAGRLGITLYPHQEEAILAVFGDENVILRTPTGSGKSLVATAVHFKAVAEGRRSFYTCPIKALVSEKFFDLCRELGPDQVGMMTGDATVNRNAPVICCTAEILANIALAEGADADVDYVVMDEFHYFADRDRGVAWQVPLLTLPQVRFVLMSATLGDVTVFERALRKHTGADVVTVNSAERPVPLHFEYAEKLVHETVQSLLNDGRAPIYIVNFTQRACAETAQALLSVNFCTKEEKARIAAAMAGESFRSPYGKEIQKLLRHGLGIHHAGLLPRYRLLVEKLAQQNLIKIICGTDTLGVGVNVPIRTVLFTKLCKYDGNKVRILQARDFHQIAGRAGRKGFDERGFVVVQAPEHVVQNMKLEAKAQSGKGKPKKFVKKKPPEWGYAHWDRATYERLLRAEPEPLTSRFKVTHAMLLQVLSRPRGGCRAMKNLVKDSFESAPQKQRHRTEALRLLRSLWEAGVVELRSAREGGGVTVNEDLQEDFSLFHALGLYLLDAVNELDRESLDYALDVVTLVESIVEDPEVILRAQVDKAKTKKLAELKAAGVEYEERMAELDKIEHPKPREDFLYRTYEAFAERHPWVLRDALRPKSIAREMVETLQPFGAYVKEYGLSRSEGLLLRYLSEVYKTLVQTVPELARTAELEDTIRYFEALVRGVDSSLLDEWERLRDPSYRAKRSSEELERAREEAEKRERALTNVVRNLLFSFLRAVDNRDFESALDLVEEGEEAVTPAMLDAAMRPFFEDGSRIRLDSRGRSPANTRIERGDEEWMVTQNILVDDEVSEYIVRGRVHLARSAAEKRPVFLLDYVGVG